MDMRYTDFLPSVISVIFTFLVTPEVDGSPGSLRCAGVNQLLETATPNHSSGAKHDQIPIGSMVLVYMLTFGVY
jgi:hypothetical protein